MPVFSAAATTLSKCVTSMTEVPSGENFWKVVASSPVPYWGRPPETVVAFLSLNPHVRKTFKPASFAAVKPASISAWVYMRGLLVNYPTISSAHLARKTSLHH